MMSYLISPEKHDVVGTVQLNIVLLMSSCMFLWGYKRCVFGNTP